VTRAATSTAWAARCTAKRHPDFAADQAQRIITSDAVKKTLSLTVEGHESAKERKHESMHSAATMPASFSWCRRFVLS
jgi:hypothetical protein